MKDLSKIFRAYDVRGVYPTEIDEETTAAICRGYVAYLKPKTVALGRDVRVSGPKLWQAAAEALTRLGVNVIDLGVIVTDQLYFATVKYGYDGGIMISASHQPAEFNGMKFVRKGSIAISADTGLANIQQAAATVPDQPARVPGKVSKVNFLPDYIQHVLNYIDPKTIKPFRVVANANFGPAGQITKEIIKTAKLPIEIIELNCNLNGTFPKGRPDPLIPENRVETEKLIIDKKADFAVAWDVDADRCFFFDDTGQFVPAIISTAELAGWLLKTHPGQIILHDPRQNYPLREAVENAGGKLLLNKAGHAFIKDGMRRVGALFAAETTGHYYFRDSFFCDQGQVPFYLILQILSVAGKSLSQLVSPWREKYAVSDEYNFQVKDVKAKIEEVAKVFIDGKQDRLDGLTVEYPDWRFNLRGSNLEPLIRLNVESKNGPDDLKEKVSKLTQLIEK